MTIIQHRKKGFNSGNPNPNPGKRGVTLEKEELP
jgi:hypothetical protein